MNSSGCGSTVDRLLRVFDNGQELRKVFSRQDISSFQDYCALLDDKETSDAYSEPMVWIGVYIAIASFVCILAMAADLLHGFRSNKFWFPCKYFSLNATSITVITVAMKLPVDLNSEMRSYMDRAAKLGSLGFMCTMMANLVPSLASTDNKTLLANIIGLCILVITMIVNICIQIKTGVISDEHGIVSDEHVLFERHRHSGFSYVTFIYIAMLLLLLITMVSSSLTIPSSKEILESKYQSINKISLTDQRLQHDQMSTVDKLRRHVSRYWVMAETGSPQFVMASNPLSTTSGVISLMVMVMNLINVFNIMFKIYRIKQVVVNFKYVHGSPYKWSTAAIFITQSIGVVVGTIAPMCRCFSVFSFKLDNKWNKNFVMFYKVEKYWTHKLHDWKQSPVLFLSSSPRSRSLISNSKSIILSLCIGVQMVIVIFCKVIWLTVIVVPIFVVSCFDRLKSFKERWFAPPIATRSDEIDKDLNNYVLRIDNKIELAEKTMKSISKSINLFILKAEKEQNDSLLELLEKSTGFDGVDIFDTDRVQPLLRVEFINSWSMPIVTLTCIAISLPNIHKEAIESLLRSVAEGLSITHLVEETLNCASEYVNIRKTTQILWHEVEHKSRWLGNPLAKSVFKGKKTTEIVKWFSDKAKQIVTETQESIDGELMENPPHALIAANSMFRIAQTIFLRYQSNIEPMSAKQLFTPLSGIIADIFCACFTNIPRVITIRCRESVIEKREASVKIAAKLLGKTTKIIEKLETCEVPSMDDDKMAYIDEWRLYLKRSIP